jgi:predicted outer membrane repeat protein
MKENRNMPLIRLTAALIVSIGIGIGLSTQPSAEAALTGPITFTVNMDDDAGDGTCDATCTLRDAVTEANNNPADDTILFAQGLTTITLSNEIVISGGAANGSLTINGPGANILIIDGGPGTNRIFSTSGIVTISGLTLTGGNGGGTNQPGSGGAIYNVMEGVLTLDSLHITGNTATQGGGIYSASLFVAGYVTVSNSTISNNSSNGDGGGIYASGPVTTVFKLINSTVSGNSAGNIGGALFITGSPFLTGIGNGSTVQISSATLTGNIATQGGKCIYLDVSHLTIEGSLLDSATSIQISRGTGYADATSDGYNLARNGLGIPLAAGDIENTDPLLGPLQDNGGPTPTHALQSGSPAIDAGDPNFTPPPDYDQRGPGFPRVVNRIDIGAYEYAITTAAVATVSGKVLKANGKAINRAAVTITDMRGNSRTTLTDAKGRYRFDRIEVNKTYLVHAETKTQQLTPQVITVKDDLSDVNFIAP